MPNPDFETIKGSMTIFEDRCQLETEREMQQHGITSVEEWDRFQALNGAKSKSYPMSHIFSQPIRAGLTASLSKSLGQLVMPEHAQANRKTRYADAENWIKYVLCADRSLQIEAFHEIQHHLTDAQYWRLLRKLLSNYHTNPKRCGFRIHLWLLLISVRRGSKEHFIIGKKNLETYSSLPDPVTIYCGDGDFFAPTMNYTLDRSVAQGVADVYGGNVDTFIIPKKNILYIGGLAREVLYPYGWHRIDPYKWEHDAKGEKEEEPKATTAQERIAQQLLQLRKTFL